MAARFASSIFAFASVLSLTACSTPEPAHVLTVFNEDDFRFWTGSGDASIEGQATGTLADGRAVSCAGQTVLLLPATAYNTELEQLLEQGKGIPTDYSRRARQYQRKSVCDDNGHFTFSNIPASLKWIVVTRVNWDETVTSTLASYIPWTSSDIVHSGGYFFQERKLGHGTNTMVLTAEDFVKDE